MFFVARFQAPWPSVIADTVVFTHADNRLVDLGGLESCASFGLRYKVCFGSKNPF